MKSISTVLNRVMLTVSFMTPAVDLSYALAGELGIEGP